MSKYRVSKLIASTRIKFVLKNDSRTMVIDFLNSSDLDLVLMQLRSPGFQSENSLSLHFENMSGSESLPIIDVYLNLEDENILKKNNHLGSLALYGISESPIDSSEDDGSGQHRILDAGPVFSKVCHQSNWSKKQFKLTLVPYHPLPDDISLTIGHIALYFHEK